MAMAMTMMMTTTIINDKVCNATVGNKSVQACYICGTSPKDITV
jgi:hypothetical protein